MIRFSAKITGNALNGLPRSLKQLNSDGVARVRVAVFQTAQAVAEHAKRLVPVSKGDRRSRKARGRPGPGELRSTIRAELSKSGAPVAYVQAGFGKLRRKSRAKTAKGKARARAKRAASQREMGNYAAIIEFGPHGRPYLRPAREAQRSAHEMRVRQALDQAVRSADRS